MKKIAIFGSTGSIGKNTIEVILQHKDKFKVDALIAAKNYKELVNQARLLNPKYIVIEDSSLYTKLKEEAKINNIKSEILCGTKEIAQIAKIKFDLTVHAITGSVALNYVANSIKAGSNIALANKESLVSGGDIIMNLIKKNKVKLYPIDSEHNAIFQIYSKEKKASIKNMILTASGGPFFDKEVDFSKITPAEALNHPTWSMGSKISIDSATMMNKGLEIIEAYYLFNIKKEKLKILIHPQSVIHGIVDYIDGSTIAMLSIPDMRVPISYALSSKKRFKINSENVSLAKYQNLTFFEPNFDKFRSLRLAYQALERLGNSPLILNAANEIAVEKFLKCEITFDKIPLLVEKILNKITYRRINSIEDAIKEDIYVKEITKETTI